MTQLTPFQRSGAAGVVYCAVHSPLAIDGLIIGLDDAIYRFFSEFIMRQEPATSKDIATIPPAKAIMDASLKAPRSIPQPSFTSIYFILTLNDTTLLTEQPNWFDWTIPQLPHLYCWIFSPSTDVPDDIWIILKVARYGMDGVE